jgi:hypothetical protein
MKIILLQRIPAAGSLRGTVVREFFFNFQSLIRRGGAPSGAAAIIVTVKSGNNLRIISEYYDFHRKCSITS